jgi:type II secretory pathway pseudopilin PulG
MHEQHRGFSLIGLLITVVCIIVLFTISMSALNRAVTGNGSAVSGTVRSTQDMIYLRSLHLAMMTASNETRRGRFPVPSMIAQSDDWSLNTTANLYSSMIAGNYISPDILISGNEYSPHVERISYYDYTAYNPTRGEYWDRGFQADLASRSHVSFAHMPLFGERYERHWQATSTRRGVLIGNRGPRDGIDDPQSYSYGRSGVWGGHVLYSDGSIEFYQTFTPPGLTFERHGHVEQDNLFAMDDGPDGVDAILSFTREMTRSGPVLQHD